MSKTMKCINFRDTTLESSFWSNRQKMVSETTIYAVWERFKETGRFDAFKFDWKEGMPNKPHIFWDSDVAKWMEAVAYILTKKQDDILEKALDDLIDLIGEHQGEDGYFNVYFTVVEPQNRFTDRGAHELYCAGHLIEAAVAYYEATGKDKFLNQMKKYGDYIEKVFVIDGSAAFKTCGHEEIELALVRLYRATGEKRYLELSKFFIDNRGKHGESHWDWANAEYAQDHLPVREQMTAEGHSVRAVYLYSAMADLALEYDDKELFTACKSLFENITARRMYITGGIGSSPSGENFTLDYDLPNLTAYTESCAAIGLTLFARRMLRLDMDSVYADITERILYNGFLSSISLDGKSFFYENPLELCPELFERDKCVKIKQRLPIAQRKEVFETSCCPPNIVRYISSICDFLYTYDNKTLYVHHYMNGRTETSLDGAPVEIIQKTLYPVDGNVTVNVKGVGCIALRIPWWCENYEIRLNGKKADIETRKGYAHIELVSNEVNTLDIMFEMKPQLVEASPKVRENAGRVALQRGPVIYCLEAVDNGSYLKDIRIGEDADFKLISDTAYGVPSIQATGYRKPDKGFESSLYRPVSKELEKVDLTFVPYFTFANRGESEMTIWVLKKNN